MVRAFANPVVLRAVVVFFCAVFAFLLGTICLRILRKKIREESELTINHKPSLETLPFHVYSTVIQQLKQQKHELQTQTQAEQRRARISESFSQAVLSNLSSGVVVFGMNGLVKQANPAAREILGFASLNGMNADEMFRTSSGIEHAAEANRDSGNLAAEVHCVLREGCSRRQVEGDHVTPAGNVRRVAVTVSPVLAVDGGLAGAACLITDRSEFERIRRELQLQSEISAEMALRLRTSLATISGYAQQLAHSRDPDLARQLAADISEEAAQLDRNIGGFLSQQRKAAAAGA